ncbi:MAG: hypothetical protein ACLFRG_04195 [Desulfococcaceae bacterium]
MKAPQLYPELKRLAEKLGVPVVEKSFRNAGVPVQSGLCKVREEFRFVMDRNLPVSEKNRLLGECLASMDHSSVFVAPAVRDFIQKQFEKQELAG